MQQCNRVQSMRLDLFPQLFKSVRTVLCLFRLLRNMLQLHLLHVCSSGYFSSSGICTSCSAIAGCFMCTDASTCQSCINGYYLSGSTCATCSSALSNCYQCDSSTTCLTCLSGYVLDSSGNCNQVTVTGGSALQAKLSFEKLAIKTSFYVNTFIFPIIRQM